MTVVSNVKKNEKLHVDHVFLSTGYKVDLKKLTMLHPSLMSQIESDDNVPVLNRCYESSVPELYFTGLSSIRAFGPLYRFVVGANSFSKRVASAIIRKLVRKPENSMDPRILEVLKTIAFEDVDVVDDERYCHYCDGGPSLASLTDRIEHRPDCFTLQVRAILRDYGMPLCVFKVTLEIQQEDGAWRAQTHFYPGFDADKLHSGFLPNEARRNVQIEKVREL